MPRAMILSTVASTLAQFNDDNMRLLKEAGYSIDVVANFLYGSATPQSKVDAFKEQLISDGITPIHVALPRKVYDLKSIYAAYRKIKKLCDENAYELLHCHSPIGSVVARLAARKARKKHGTKVIYTAHGFHFFKGAPFVNWLLYFTMEWISSFYTDILITINQEDFSRAKKHLHARRTEYIPGIGLDLEKLFSADTDRMEKRKSLGIDEDEIAVLSVGELNDNKNHETVLRAIAKIENVKLSYFICGKGKNEEHLSALAKCLGVKLTLCGFRDDVLEICKAADIFAFPSKREGLGIAALEAMAMGLPLVGSAVHGIPDYLENGVNGFSYAPLDVEGFVEGIGTLAKDAALREKMGNTNKETVKAFDKKTVSVKMQTIYKGI